MSKSISRRGPRAKANVHPNPRTEQKSPWPEPSPAHAAWLEEAQRLLGAVQARRRLIRHRRHESPEEYAISYLSSVMQNAFELCTMARANGQALEIATAVVHGPMGAPISHFTPALCLAPPGPKLADVIDIAPHIIRRAGARG